MKKSLYNFYLDDEKKKLATEKLERLCGEKTKGQLASYLRVCINRLIDVPDEKFDKTVLNSINEEYMTCLKLNKRSKN